MNIAEVDMTSAISRKAFGHNGGGASARWRKAFWQVGDDLGTRSIAIGTSTWRIRLRQKAKS
jgi:hypothetical protein